MRRASGKSQKPSADRKFPVQLAVNIPPSRLPVNPNFPCPSSPTSSNPRVRRPTAVLPRTGQSLKFGPSLHQIQIGTLNPADGIFSGTLQDSSTHASEELTEENSQIIPFTRDFSYLTSLPPISLRLSLGLMLAAVVMNPLTRIQLPKPTWMLLDVLILALLGYAWHLMREENAGRRPHFSLTRSLGEPPGFAFMSFNDVGALIRRLWPAILGGSFVLGLLGSQIGGGNFEDFSLFDVAYKTVGALVVAALLAIALTSAFESIASKGNPSTMRTVQVPGEIIITAFLLIFLSAVFRGFFIPEPHRDPADYPPGYVPYDQGDDF